MNCPYVGDGSSRLALACKLGRFLTCVSVRAFRDPLRLCKSGAVPELSPMLSCESDPRDKTVHLECAVSQNPRHQTRTLNYLQSRTKRSRFVPSPGRSVTRARGLYVSRLANSVKATDPKYGAVHKDVHCRHCAKDGAFGGYPAPQRQELERLVCSAS